MIILKVFPRYFLASPVLLFVFNTVFCSKGLSDDENMTICIAPSTEKNKIQPEK